jgi:hypothetical protein
VKPATTALERVAIVAASLALSIGLIALLSGFFAGRDQAGLSGSSSGPGLAFPDLGDAHLAPGQPRPGYNSDPPTSGPHVPEPVVRDEARINDDQLLEALEAGDVVVLYGASAPPPGLRSFAGAVAAPFTPALAAAGGAVILSRRPGTIGLVGAAWRHLISVRSASDPALRNFAEYWLGKGAPGR